MLIIIPSCKKSAELSSEIIATINKKEDKTEAFPLFNYKQGRTFNGVSTDLLVEIWDDIKTNLTNGNIQLLDWSAAIQKVDVTNNKMLFSTGRIPERKNNLIGLDQFHPLKKALFVALFAGTSIDTSTRLQGFVTLEMIPINSKPFFRNSFLPTGPVVIFAAGLAFSTFSNGKGVLIL